MKWLVFTGAVVAGLVSLGILAVDERDVVWEGRTPHCPYCRTALPNHLALVCAHCRKSFDWAPHNETCRWCLDRNDVEYLRDLFASLRIEQGPLPGALAEFPIAYFRAMDEGACTHCGGLGDVLRDGATVECPVCRGQKTCIACSGDRVVIIGDPEAHQRARERKHLRERGQQRAEVTGLPLKETMLVAQDVEALSGYAEAEHLADARGRNLLEWARARLERAFRALAVESAIRCDTAGPARG